ncbi:MAG: GNAT family N-acetyltransferase [Pseudoxanthomonas sp.]
MSERRFHVEAIDYASGLAELRTVRETVFVQEQQVPIEEEWDALDPLCRHVLARDQAGQPIGTGRLTPEHKIGRMAVLADWRGQGVGEAMLAQLMAEARKLGWPAVSLNAQVSAESFYARQGFIPHGERFWEAGIEHQAMRRALHGPTLVEDKAGAIAALVAVATHARRALRIYSRELDPGLLDNPAVLEALRRFATATRGGEVQVLVQDAAIPQRTLAPLIALGQRLPSVFAFREVREPVDRAYASAFIANDLGGYYFRNLGHRFDGEADLEGAGRARQLRDEFGRFWERSRPCTEYRALGI